MKVVFLDIDGVLNRHHTKEKSFEGYTGIDELNLTTFAPLIKETGAKIVLTSSWRSDWVNWHLGSYMKKDGKYLDVRFESVGLTIYDSTSTVGEDRGQQVEDYINKHPEIDRFVIIDDEHQLSFKKHRLSRYFLCTNWYTGITSNIVNRAIKYLNCERENLY